MVPVKFVDDMGQIEASGKPSGKNDGKWLIEESMPKRRYSMNVDDMPDHWIEQVNNWQKIVRRRGRPKS
jgi:hypothetical protein